MALNSSAQNESEALIQGAKTVKYLQVVCPEVVGGQVGEKFKVGEVIAAASLGPGCVMQLDHETPIYVLREKELSSPGRRVYVALVGFDGLALVETIKGGRFQERDTRRLSDWCKIYDKRVFRRMMRQSAKYWDSGDLKLARSHKR